MIIFQDSSSIPATSKRICPGLLEPRCGLLVSVFWDPGGYGHFICPSHMWWWCKWSSSPCCRPHGCRVTRGGHLSIPPIQKPRLDQGNLLVECCKGAILRLHTSRPLGWFEEKLFGNNYLRVFWHFWPTKIREISIYGWLNPCFYHKFW